ncbi:MAG: FAD-binding protein [Chloroflexi bacterium]|nr:FAD-binding protein [Chloroflexota bacterium]
MAGVRETDVLVVGYGLSGAVAAVVAHDAGARVLMVEKGKYPGGCSILSGGGIKCVRDAEAATAYLKELCGGRTPDEVVGSFAQGLAGNEEFVRKLAETDGATVRATHGLASGEMSGVYPFPGRDTWYEVRVVRVPGFTGFPWVTAARNNGINMFKLAMDNVEARHIPVLFDTPARRLVQDGQGAVTGLVIEEAGQEVEVRARRAVVLATGGFEQSEWLRLQYLQGKPFYSMAPLTHTGDGILMAQKAGAALWHMWHVHGSYGFKFPEYPIGFRHPFGGYRQSERKMPWIVVDRRGERYMNEYHPAPADTNHRPMETFDPDLACYPRIPSTIVFDDVGRRYGPIGQPMGFGDTRYEWSRDNLKELDKGWIIRADSLRELAGAIRNLPENGGLMDADALEANVTRWNGLIEAGPDPLGRPPGTMMAISTPPFYAATVWPIITNTQGGPVHNERQQTLDPFGQPIPRLYSVGELGSFFGHLYELGGNLGECFVSGRMAGQHAAAEPPLA